MTTARPMRLAVLVAAACAFAVARPEAAEIKLKAGYFIPPSKSLFRVAFEDFVADVNKRGKGVVQISQIVGPESVGRGQWCNAIKSGILDITSIPPAYCSNLIPGIEAMDVATVPPDMQRKNGATAFIASLFSTRAQVQYLGQWGHGIKYHLFLRTPVRSFDDFSKLRLRTTPAYTSFFKAMGAQTIRTRRGEVFTAMERGVVDGFANPLSEVKPMGWHQVSKYVVYPGFYNPSLVTLVNAKKWSGLTERQRDVLMQSSLRLENDISSELARLDAAEGEKLIAGGLKKIDLSAADSQRFLTVARESRWKDVIRKAPDYGPKLRKLLTR